MGVWVPICPTLDKDGAFSALAHLPDAATLKPLAAPNDEFQMWWERGDHFSASVAVTLGIAGVVDIASRYSSVVIAYDVALFSETPLGTPPNGFIYGTRWGAGLRTRVTVFNFDVKSDFKLGTIAAAASLGLCEASFHVEGMGISSPEILSYLPGPGRFDEHSHSEIMKAIDKVRKEVLAPKKGLTAVPLMILVPSAAFVSNPIVRAQSFLYGVRGVAYGKSLNFSLEEAGVSYDPIAIRTVYARYCPKAGDDETPGKDSSDQAKDWLKHCRVAQD